MVDSNNCDSATDPDYGTWLKGRITYRFGLQQASSRTALPVVCCLVRDGSYWLPSFFDHHRKVGVEEFFFLDNGSTDDTLKILQNETGVGVYSVDSRYFKEFNRQLRRFFIELVRPSGWILGLDIDEYFDYPYSDEITLSQLSRYLDDNNYNAVATHMLDMLPEGSIGELAKLKTSDPRILCPYYSLDGLVGNDYSSLGDIFKGYPANSIVLPTEDWKFYCDGIRRKKFGVRLWLTKHSLFNMDGSLVPYHHAHFHRNVRIANISAVLYHYKFSPFFETQVQNALVEKQYCDDSYDYVCYDKTLNSGQNVILRDHTAKKLESVYELLNQSFLNAPYNFKNYFKNN